MLRFLTHTHTHTETHKERIKLTRYLEQKGKKSMVYHRLAFEEIREIEMQTEMVKDQS